MFTRRRSRAFLMEDIDRGKEFVEVLKTIYPKGTTLDAKDFDWLFDCPETEHFLEWFCNTVGEENMLTTTELEDYEKLVISGKPILEGEVLEEMLKTCSQSFQLNSELPENEALPLELLEQELEMLKDQCACKKMRFNKLQIYVASVKQKHCHLADEKERLNRELKKMHQMLELEKFQNNDILSDVCQITEKLVHWHKEPGYEQLTLSRDLGHYLETEENFTKAFLKLFPNAVTSMINDMEIDQTTLGKKGQRDITEQLTSESTTQQLQLEDKSSVYIENPDNHKTTLEVLKDQILFQEQLSSKNKPEFKQEDLLGKTDQPKAYYFKTEGLPVQDFSQKGLKTQAEIGQTKHLNNVESYREELGHMELTYMWSKTNIVMTTARTKGISFALQWAEKVLKVTKENKMKEEKGELSFRVTRCQEQLCILQREADRNTQLLMSLLQDIARLFRLPIINGELDLEDMKLEYLEHVQEEAIDQLLGQLSHLEVMRLLLMLNTKNLQWTRSKLEGLLTVLKESQSEECQSQSEECQTCFKDSRFSVKQFPQTLIEQSDFTTLRMWKMLDKHNQEKQLFHSYDTLASRGSKLCQELKMLQVHLATPFPQVLKLESENKALYSLMHGDSNQLMLHAQELSEPLEQLNIMQAKINQILMDTQTDLKSKRKALQSHFQKTERSLYIYFFSNPDLLRKMVEKVEKQIQASL